MTHLMRLERNQASDGTGQIKALPDVSAGLLKADIPARL